jgi:hypothetical protein
MAFTSILTLLLSVLALDGAIPTRIVASSESPVSLVGLPCGDDAKKLRAVELEGANVTHLESASFLCQRDCTVGVRVKDAHRISSFTVATAMAHDRGRVIFAVGPALDPSSLRSCSGETFVVASMPRIAWPAAAGIVYVAEIAYQDGTTWRVDDDALQESAFRRIFQPR